jgi:uncharacterized membrane protein YbhN (UPF0104 family)
VRSAVLKGALKAAVGVALIGLLLHRAEPGAVWRTMNQAQGSALAAGLLGFVVSTVFEVLKLHAVIVPRRPLVFTARLVFAGLFYNTFLPANVGGDAYRVVVLRGQGDPLGQAVLPVFLDRATGVIVQLAAGALVVAFRGTGWLAGPAGGWDLPRLPGGAGPWIAGCVAVAAALWAGWRRWGLGERVGTLWAELKAAWRLVPGAALVGVTGGSVLYHAGRVTGLYFFLHALGAHVDWLDLVVVLTVVTVVSTVPVSIGALGVREGALTAMLVVFGVAPAVALAVALLNLGVLWAKALIGGVWLLAPAPAGRTGGA